MVFIWAKILALDEGCRGDLVREGGERYFVNVLSGTEDHGARAAPGPAGADPCYDFLGRMVERRREGAAAAYVM
jgi:hypothetical protein